MRKQQLPVNHFIATFDEGHTGIPFEGAEVRRMVDILRLVQDCADRCFSAFLDQGTSFTCGEAEAIAALLDTVEDGLGEAFLAEHATGDDEGDDHYLGE